MKSQFWKADWFLGVVIVVAMLVFNAASNLIPGLERWAYDLGVKMTSKSPSDKIAVIAIDEQSIANIGRWPWPREVQAKLIDQLSAARAKVIGNTVFFFEPQIDPGLAYVEKMLAIYDKAYPGAAPQEAPGVGVFGAATPAAQVAQPSGEVSEIGKLLREASVALNNDVRLAASVKKAGNVVVPMVFDETMGVQPPGKPDKPLPEYVARNAISGTSRSDGSLIYGVSVSVPIEQIGANVAAIGHLNSTPDPADGAVRSEPLVIDYYGQQFPSLALMIAARSLNLGAKDIKVNPGESVALGNKVVRTDEQAKMFTYFYKDRDARPAFPVDSFFDVYTGKIPATKYADKIVLIGAVAAGIGTNQVTPISAQMNPVTTLAHSVSSLLQEHFFVAPTWGTWATIVVYLLVAAYLIAVLPRLGAGMGAILTALLLVALFGAHLGLMTGAGLWLQLMLPAALLVVGHLLLTTKRFLVTERGKEKADSEGAESNRMLGLVVPAAGPARHGLRQVPQVPLRRAAGREPLLARPRLRAPPPVQQGRVRVRSHPPAGPEVQGRGRAHAARQDDERDDHPGRLLGGALQRRDDGAAGRADGKADARPLPGREGAGQGRHGRGLPRQGPEDRPHGGDQDAGARLRIRGRRVAGGEGALLPRGGDGRAPHAPSIVTIYDAGEEHDLAYIAMEFLRGKDLVPYTKAGSLLPPDKVLSIVERVADALGYAHSMGVVHRDIKPANIMYEPESDTAEGHRLRHRAHHRFVQDEDRHGAGHPVLHVAGAARRQEDRRPLGPLLARRHALPDALPGACRSRASR